ncbi:MAG: hypothetical protein IT164_01100 [Bryobacterales bacterium]|nr:hypothetical protein [Bryobacterales bacterium]
MRGFAVLGVLFLVAELALPVAAAPSSKLLENRDGQNRAFTGIGRLSLSTSCTAFFIRTPGGSNASAYALAAGHCYSITSNDIFVNQTLPASTRPVRFRYFVDTQDQQLAVPVRRLAYSTMRGWDVAVIELATTAGELQAQGVTPLQLEPGDPLPGTAITVVGAPGTNFPASEQFLRQGRCTLGERVDLIEFVWHFWNVRRNDCEDIVGGVSGSPVISERTGNVVGIVNTTTHLAFQSGGDFDCYAGRPCELGGGAQKVEEETSYSVPVAGLLGCFSGEGVFAHDRAECPLPRATPRIDVSHAGRNRRPGAAWDVAVTGEAAYYRYKTMVAGAGDCRDAAGYSAPVPREARGVISDRLPEAENRYLMCVIGGGSPAPDHPSWQLPRDAVVLIARTDATPPLPAPLYRITSRPSEEMSLAFDFLPPELSSYEYKIGAPDSTRCAEPGYRIYRRIPVSLPDTGSYRICLRATDEAGNEQPPVDFVVGRGPVILPTGVAHATGFRPDVFAPGQWISVYGLDLQGATPRLRGSSGSELPLEIGYTSAEQINARLPLDAPAGQANLVLGERAEPMRIGPLSPGIFLAEQTGANEILVYTTGLASARAGDLRAWIGRLELAVLEAGSAGIPGVEVIRLRLPEGTGLQGLQFLQLAAGQVRSNRRGVVLR